MKFSELLEEYLTLRESMNADYNGQQWSAENKIHDLNTLKYLAEEMDKIVEGINRAEQS